MAELSQRDREFTAFLDADADSLRRRAALVSGDPVAGGELLRLALVRTYLAWPRVGPHGALAYATRAMGGSDAAGGGAGPEGSEVPLDPHAVLEDGQEAVRGRRMGWTVALLTIGFVVVAFGVPPLIAALVP